MKTRIGICCMALAVLAIVATGAWAEEVWTFDDGLEDWEQEGDGPAEDPGLGFFFPDGERSWLCDGGGKLIWTQETDPGHFGITYLRAPNLTIAGNEFFVVSINATGVAGQTLGFAARTLPSNVVNLYTTVLQDGLNVYSFDITTEADGADDEINLIRLDLPGAAGTVYEIDWAALTDSASFVPASQSTSCGDDPPPPTITPSSGFAVADTIFTLTVPTGGTGYQWSMDGGDLTGETTNVLTFDTVQEGDTGLYEVSYDDLSKAPINLSYFLTVLPSGTTLPLAGLLGLGLLASACAMGGASVLRRKK